MKISHRLIIQSIAAAIALLGVGALGLLGVRHIQQELYVMTGDIIPLKNKLLKVEQSKEQALSSLLALSHSRDPQDASTIKTDVDSKLEQLQGLVGTIGHEEEIGEIDISAFYQTREDILENINANFAGIASYKRATLNVTSSLEQVSASVEEVNEGIQDINDNASAEAQQARDNALELLAEQQEANLIARLLGRANVLLHAINGVDSKYQIAPLREQLETLTEDIEAEAEESSEYENLAHSIEQISGISASLLDPENGLLQRKAVVVEKQLKSSIPYNRKLRELSTLIEEADTDITSLIEDLDFEIYLANEEMGGALSFSSDPSSITAVNQALIITTRDMQIGLQDLFASTDTKTLSDEYKKSMLHIETLGSHASKLTTELKKLELASLSAAADKISLSIEEVKSSVQQVNSDKLALFSGATALKASIDALKQVSQTQREQGQEMMSSVNSELSTVIESVDNKVSQSTSLIVAISLVAVIFSAAFSYITIRAILGRLQRALQVAEMVSSGDLSPVEKTAHKDEVSSVLDALARMVSMLDSSVRQIRSASASVNQGAEEISNGNSELNKRSGQQALHLNDTANSTRKINELAQTGAGSIQQVSQLSSTAADAAGRGREVVQDAMRSMANIESGAKEISNIISVIDSIAFQTNILALNAAVEASRAGEVGRGFAVVASEVRALASKSKESANQIKEIIDSNVADVEEGSALVNNAGQHIEDVVAKVDEVKTLIEDIAVSSKQQVESISNIDSSVDEIESMTQKNASLSEHTSGAASDLLKQARSLDQAVSVFKL